MAPPPATVNQIYERFPASMVACAFAAESEASMPVRQTTLARAARCKGIGLHTGRNITMTLRPAAADNGIVFVRKDMKKAYDSAIPAICGRVVDGRLSSKIGNQHGCEVGTIEHVMAALALLGIDNAFIEVNGPEVPIMDGSAAPFVTMLRRAGKVELAAARRVLRIKKPVRVENGDAYCELLPDSETVFEAEIDFESRAIGRQSHVMKLSPTGYDENVANARTFCMQAQVDAMHKAGLALGGSMDNAVVVDETSVLNEEGLRSPQEFVEHKLLDAIGDLYLLGLNLVGRYRGYKSGHALHHKLLAALYANPDAFEIVSLADDFDAGDAALTSVMAAE
jgi:UDP-3-O-[3-hydroxymyristoyl] N-acetylglucosamine deacetylase